MSAHTADTVAIVIALVSLAISLQTVICLVCGLRNPVGTALLQAGHRMAHMVRHHTQ